MIFDMSVRPTFRQTVDSIMTILDTLRLVQIVTRFGDRNPVFFYPNDPYSNASYWPQGLGVLTTTGQGELTRLGAYIRNAYKYFIPEDYTKEEVYVRSTNFSWTRASATAFMKGLFNITDFTDIETVNSDSDELYTPMFEKDCPVVKRESEIIRASSKIVEFLEDNNSTLNYIKSNAGSSFFYNLLDDFQKCFFIYENLFAENLRNFSLPEWTKSVFPEYLKKMYDKGISIYYNNEDIRRVQGGLLKTLTNNMILRMKKENDKMFYLFSGHDASIIMLLRAIGADNVHLEFASYMVAELHEMHGEFHIRFLLQNKTIPENSESFQPMVVKVPGCEEMCPWNKFIDTLSGYMPVDWKAECNNVTGSGGGQLWG